MLTVLWCVFSICQLSTCDVSTSVIEPTLVLLLLLTSGPFSLNSRHTLRRAHTSSNAFLNLALQQQSDTDVESHVSSIILRVMGGEDAYDSNFYY